MEFWKEKKKRNHSQAFKFYLTFTNVSNLMVLEGLSFPIWFVTEAHKMFSICG